MEDSDIEENKLIVLLNSNNFKEIQEYLKENPQIDLTKLKEKEKKNSSCKFSHLHLTIIESFCSASYRLPAKHNGSSCTILYFL